MSVALAMLAIANYTYSDITDKVIANIEYSDLFKSSLSGIDFTDYGNPKMVASYYSIVYGVEKESYFKTIQCESGFKHEGLYGDHGLAYGVAQFHLDTFKANCPDLDYTDMNDQLNCMAKMFTEHQQHQWTCFHR